MNLTSALAEIAASTVTERFRSEGFVCRMIGDITECASVDDDFPCTDTFVARYRIHGDKVALVDATKRTNCS